MFSEGIHHSSFVMLLLLVSFAVIHSGGAALRVKAESLIGPRAWRLIFASLSIPAAGVLIIYFLAHRYDGIRLWNLQGVPGMVQIVWCLTALSFLFLYPATYNLLEIPALAKPQMRLYEQGIIRITRHPQAVGQIIWCFAHGLWIGSSFMMCTCFGLIGHHLFAVWHGDKRLREKFGADFEELKRNTSVIPFLAVINGRQTLEIKEFLRPSQFGICIAVATFWWGHRFISFGSEVFLSSKLSELLA
ncbi:NnrU family protein [Prochlorococcus marinus]|uniref:Predicted membrane protein n=1 Tax=Prochlorococcus marinus (strain MIT 9211) TaxID=93059 RepID=A9BD06_PROM4|nr:NnrU family protein [Prochlorococcus marinus]ABX08094.1 Predicted membrane protein [Prochlorococcus marinus str. MIT 9211]